MRMPSIVLTGYRDEKYAVARSTSPNFCSSGTSTRISGVVVVFGRSASNPASPNGRPLTISSSRAAANSASSNPR